MKIALTFALGALALAVSAPHVLAAERAAKAPSVRTEGTAQPTDARYTRKHAAHPRQFAGRRTGFYSYSYRDVIGRYRDPYLDRQTQAGPFDYGFFFDSGITPRGGDSPYMR